MLRVSFQNFLITLVIYYQSLYIIALGATPSQLGLAMSSGAIAGAIIAIPTGWIADRHGVKKIFLFGTLIMAIGAIFLVSASYWTAAIPGLFMNVLGFILVQTVCPVVCGSCLKNKERATGMQLCDTLSAVPRLIAPMMGAILVTSFGGISVEGIKPLYFIQFVGFSLIFIFIYRQFSDPYKVKPFKQRIDVIKDIKEIFKRGRMVKRWILYYALSSFAFSITYLAGFVALYANVVKHADQYVLGIMASTLMIVPLTLSIVVGKLADTFGRKRILFVTIPIYCLSLLILIGAKNSTTLIISSVLQGFLILNLTTEGAIAVELVPVNLLGKWMGMLYFIYGCIGIIAPVIAGYLWSLISPAAIFFFLIGTELMLIPLLMTMPETLVLRTRT
jgi:MFS family permease